MSILHRGSQASPRELVCIACPMACRLTVSTTRGGEVNVTGNRCPRGELYGREEVLAPRRILTAVVPTDSAHFPCAPVRTDRAIGRAMVSALLRELYARRVSLPVRQGQVLIEDFDGARVVFTRTLPPDEISAVGKTGSESEGEDEVSLFQKAP
jgi:CxxC motif-containing protein